MDLAYVEEKLEKLQLLAFYRNTVDTAAVWFDEGADTEMTDFITERIFRSGSYGVQKNQLLSSGVKASKSTKKRLVKQKKMLELIFPSVKSLSSKYTVLKKLPFLFIQC